jgi:hypothetical protein
LFVHALISLDDITIPSALAACVHSIGREITIPSALVARLYSFHSLDEIRSHELWSPSSLSFAATIFGQLWRMEPLLPEKKAMWRREMEWLLCLSDHVVELMPTWQTFPDGTKLEVTSSLAQVQLNGLLHTQIINFRSSSVNNMA